MRQVTLLLALVLGVKAQDQFRFPVYREKTLHDERGKLEISETALSYRSDNGKASFTLPFSEIREADTSDPRRIRLTTYDVVKRRLGGHEVLTFRLEEGKYREDLTRFFAAHIERPVIGTYGVPTENTFEIPAYHRELLGGSHGRLVIGREAIRFLTKNPKESRTWLYRDIETIGGRSPFDFRITTYAETFTFDLKERLPDKAYRLAWEEIYERKPEKSHADKP
jgi:hypothetical protein